MPRRLPDATLTRAVELVGKGYSQRVAAIVTSCTDRALPAYLRRQGTPPGPWGPHAGRWPPYAGRWPCRFCDAPVPERGAVCPAPACRARLWDELTPEERHARMARQGRPDVPPPAARYQAHAAEGRRVDVHLLLTPAQAAQLREQAAMRRVSMSALVAEALGEAGLIDA